MNLELGILKGEGLCLGIEVLGGRCLGSAASGSTLLLTE